MNPPPDDCHRSLAGKQAKINLLLAMNAVANLHLRDGKQIIEDRQREIRGLKSQLEDMLNSRSWRITEPLRSVTAWLEKRET